MPTPPRSLSPSTRSRRLYLQVLVAIALGILLGHFKPAWAVPLKPIADGFIQLIRVFIAPIVFCTVVGGIARMGSLRQVGRLGLKAIVYFEALTTVALGLGLLVGELLKPGSGIHADVGNLDVGALTPFTSEAEHLTFLQFVLHLVPQTFAQAFVKGDILQVLVLGLLFGAALVGMGEAGERVTQWVEDVSQVFFRIIGFVMRLAPLGAFAAMAFTVGQYGLKTVAGLAELVGCFYLTSLLFVTLGLGLVLRRLGLPLFGLLQFLRDEILLVLGTSSSESALPGVMTKLEQLGCRREVVRLVVPLGYSFNLDGTCIYLTLALLFTAQATDTPLTFGHKLALLGLLLLTSKGAATVTGGGFITLAATLSVTHQIPLAGLALLLGVDRFMSEARAVTNLVGNSVATLVIAKWEGALDMDVARAALGSGARRPVVAE